MTSASGVRPWGVVLDSEEDDGQEARTRAGSPPVMRDLRRRVLFPLLAMALGLVGLELAANLGERVAYGAFYWHDQPVGLYGSGPGQRPQLKPGARLNGLLYSIHVNSLGFRGPELADPKPDNGLRVWFLGGSTTFDIFVPDDETAWPAQVGALLQDALPDRAVEVVNAGVPGAWLSGGRQDLERWGPSVRPDYVVVYHGPNDLHLVRRTVMPPTPLPPPLPSAAYRVLQRTLDAPPARVAAFADMKLEPRQLSVVLEEYRRTVDLARRLGATPVLATHAIRAAPGVTGEEARVAMSEAATRLFLSPEAALDALEQVNQGVTALARGQHLPWADLRSAVPPDDENWGDAIHFRPPGSALAARAMADTILADLKRRGTVPGTPPRPGMP